MYDIKIDKEKCKDPLNCGKCLQRCPLALFCTYPLNRQPKQICEEWAVEPAFPDLCIGCMVCVQNCPNQAITVKEIA